MKTVRLFLYFIIGLLLSAVVTFSYAGTLQTWYESPALSGQFYSTQDEVCTQWIRQFGLGKYVFLDVTGGVCHARVVSGGATTSLLAVRPIYSCSDWAASRWPTADVPQCASATCTAGTHSTAARWRGTFAAGSVDHTYGEATPMPATLCDGQCVGTPDKVTTCTATSVAVGTPIKCSIDIILTGGQCSSGLGPAPVDPTIGKPNPPCPLGDGVMSGASGKVVCVPPTTPGATTPPVKTSTSSSSTAPDGSTSTTNTTNTCTGEGACSTTTNTTVTGVGGVPSTTPGVVAGQSGTPGTTTEITNKPPESTSDFCAKNPQMQMCKGGMNEEATQKKIADELHSLTTPGSFNGEGLTAASKFTAGTDLEGEDKKFSDAVMGITADPTGTKKSAWGEAMSSGWFDPIPQTGCSPFTTNFAGRDISLDICPTAKRISDVGGYAMWFVLAIGTFVMLTGGRSTTEA